MFEWFLAYVQGEFLGKTLVVQYEFRSVEVDAENMLAIDDIVSANTSEEVSRLSKLLDDFFSKTTRLNEKVYSSPLVSRSVQ